jgi:hypothetical protein
MKKEINPIPDEVLSWLTVGGFLDLYHGYINNNTTTLKAAYELAEADYKKAYKKRKYLDYNNFLKSKYQYTKRLLMSKKSPASK